MKLITNIGAVSLAVDCSLKAGKQDDASLLALRHLLAHKAPSIAFKKDSGMKRDGEYSPAMEAQVKAAARAALEPIFDIAALDAGRYVKEASKADVAIAVERRKAWEAMSKLSEDIANQMYPEFVQAEKPVEPEMQGEE